MSARLLLVTAIITMPIALGCGDRGGDTPALGRVTGTVTIDGKPASNLTVTFSPKDGGRPSTGTTDAEGRYKLVYSSTNMGAAIGVHSVKVAKNVNLTEAQLADPNVTLKTGDPIVAEKLARWSKQVEVKGGSNAIDLELSSK